MAMVGSALTGASQLTGRRFFFTALLPSLGFTALSVLTVAVQQYGAAGAVRRWSTLGADAQALLTMVFLITVAVLALALSAMRHGLLRCFEGRWRARLLRRTAELGCTLHRRRIARLTRRMASSDARDANAAYEVLHTAYPLPTHPEDVMPTRLGNVLRAAELYSWDRYSIDAPVIWPRLFPLLPTSVTSSLAQARGDMELVLSCTLLAGCYGLGTGSCLVVAGAPWQWPVLCLAGGIAGACGAYRAAVSSAIVYGQHMRVTFDLYRGLLPAHLGTPPPADPAEEARYWARMGQFWYRGIPLTAVNDDLPEGG